ncbi:MAG: PaaI family thioesterase [Rhodobacteraceae bacterium]|nr:PaaI family thioesterase [Paracoccaceae bacterium]
MVRLREELERPPFNRWLGLTALSADPGEGVSVELPFRRELGHSPSEPVFHGGVVASLIDAAGFAAVAIGHDGATPTVSLHVDYLAPASGDRIIANARIRRAGRLLARVDIDVLAAGRLVAIGRGVFISQEQGH